MNKDGGKGARYTWRGGRVLCLWVNHLQNEVGQLAEPGLQAILEGQKDRWGSHLGGQDSFSEVENSTLICKVFDSLIWIKISFLLNCLWAKTHKETCANNLPSFSSFTSVYVIIFQQTTVVASISWDFLRPNSFFNKSVFQTQLR